MRVDLYTNPHKEQREWLYRAAVQAGKIDYENDSLVIELHTDFLNLVADLNQHVRAEEAFVHPLYLAKAQGLAQPLHEEHENLELTLQSLTHQMNIIKSEVHVEKRGDLGLAFYRSFNRFISEYLDHIDSEERMLPFLWETYKDEQLMLCMMTYKASIGSEEAMDKILAEFPAQEKETQHRLFCGFKNNAPPVRFMQFCDLLKKSLPAKDLLLLERLM